MTEFNTTETCWQKKYEPVPQNVTSFASPALELWLQAAGASYVECPWLVLALCAEAWLSGSLLLGGRGVAGSGVESLRSGGIGFRCF